MNRMMLVGVISDTHGRLHERAYEALVGCDHIIHAGDIGDPAILRELETIAQVTAVLGNNDFNEYGSKVQRFARPVIGQVRFLVAHFPEDVRVRPGDSVPEACIHGHTHIPRIVYGKAARPAGYVVCPGSASYPRGGSDRCIAKIELESAHVQSIRIETLDGKAVSSLGSMS